METVRAGARHRPAPDRQADFAHLSLDGLRGYRQALVAEEGRVSYWRRLVQARLDLVQSARCGLPPAVDNLRGLLQQPQLGPGRRVLLEVLPDDDMPPLPNLPMLWDTDPLPGDEEHNDQLARDLMAAEAQLSAYRAALHRRLTAATGELIARYREQPLLCLSVLPTTPPTAPPAPAAATGRPGVGELPGPPGRRPPGAAEHPR